MSFHFMLINFSSCGLRYDGYFFKQNQRSVITSIFSKELYIMYTGCSHLKKHYDTYIFNLKKKTRNLPKK